MYFTVKTLLSRGKSQRFIAKELGISRNTVKSIKEKLDAGNAGPPPQTRPKKLADYHDQIMDMVENNKSAVLVHDKLGRIYEFEVSYPTVVRYIRQFKKNEVFVPVVSDPGEEAQVDFGYLGRFIKDGKLVKVWGFSCVLSHSRHAYYEGVLNQKVSTFIACHIHAFEYFGGVPATVRIDNLKAGVITPNFYEPVIQEHYARFLEYYESAPIVCRPNHPESKGKVESGIKYAKNNFLPRIDHRNYYRLGDDLKYWNDNVCNTRIHGTTRKVPKEVFEQVEKQTLIPLPARRYEIYDIEQRKASTYHHVGYKYNYYSVPHNYAGESLTIKSNGSILKIYKEYQEIALHSIVPGEGQYITREEHKPPHKQKKSREHYLEQVNRIGPSAVLFMQAAEESKPRHWHDFIRGVISLARKYDNQSVEQSCKRALDYGAVNYQTVKNILKKGLYKVPIEDLSAYDLGGYGHELHLYDNLMNNKP